MGFSGFEFFLRDVFAIVGVDDKAWNGIRDCKSAHKSHDLLMELLIALQIFFVLLYLGQLDDEARAAYDSMSDDDKASHLAQNLDAFLEQVKSKDKVLAVWINIFEAARLCAMAWEATRVEHHSMFMYAVYCHLISSHLETVYY